MGLKTKNRRFDGSDQQNEFGLSLVGILFSMAIISIAAVAGLANISAQKNAIKTAELSGQRQDVLRYVLASVDCEGTVSATRAACLNQTSWVTGQDLRTDSCARPGGFTSVINGATTNFAIRSKCRNPAPDVFEYSVDYARTTGTSIPAASSSAWRLLSKNPITCTVSDAPLPFTFASGVDAVDTLNFASTSGLTPLAIPMQSVHINPHCSTPGMSTSPDATIPYCAGAYTGDEQTLLKVCEIGFLVKRGRACNGTVSVSPLGGAHTFTTGCNNVCGSWNGSSFNFRQVEDAACPATGDAACVGTLWYASPKTCTCSGGGGAATTCSP